MQCYFACKNVSGSMPACLRMARSVPSGMSPVFRDRCVPVQRWVKPDLMGARRLTVEFQAELFQALDDLAVAEPRELPHQVATTSG